jgi:hypothetical protein
VSRQVERSYPDCTDTAATCAAQQKLNTAKCDEQMAKYLNELLEEADGAIVELLKQREPFLTRFVLAGRGDASRALAHKLAGDGQTSMYRARARAVAAAVAVVAAAVVVAAATRRVA